MVMTLGGCDHGAESILDLLETPEFSLGETKIKLVAVIKLRMNKCCGYWWMQFSNQYIRPRPTTVASVNEAGFTEGRNLTVIRQVC